MLLCLPFYEKGNSEGLKKQKTSILASFFKKASVGDLPDREGMKAGPFLCSGWGQETEQREPQWPTAVAGGPAGPWSVERTLSLPGAQSPSVRGRGPMSKSSQ